MDTQDTTSTSPAPQMRPEEMRGLAKRLRARADSVLMRDQPHQQSDLRQAASLIEQLASLTAEILTSAALIDGSPGCLRSREAPDANSPKLARLVVTFHRGGREIESERASSGERALKIGWLMLALDDLQAGDQLTVHQDDGGIDLTTQRGSGR